MPTLSSGGTFENNWKNILDKLENILKSEFKGAVPVCRGTVDMRSNQYLRLIPDGSALLDYMHTAELRQFDIEMLFYFKDPNMKKNSLDHVFRQVSRIEALIHDNTATTLSDSSNLFNVNLSSCDLDVGDSDSEYVVSWDLSCQHLGNIA